MSLRRLAVVLVLVAVAATIAYAVGRSTPESARSLPPTTSSSSSTTTAVVTVPVPGDIRAALAALVVDDRRPPDGYSRDLFPTWLDLDGNGCDARVDVLVQESLTPAQVDRTGSCAVLAGDWHSRYDGVDVSDPAELDVDHLVPLGEAWRSGADTWTADRRAAYANDVTDEDQLVAVTASSNRSKGDRDPSEWRPPDRSSWCWYATHWVRVKVRWHLTADTAERDALGQMLETCS
jgi:hypothetical protein